MPSIFLIIKDFSVFPISTTMNIFAFVYGSSAKNFGVVVLSDGLAKKLYWAQD